MSLEDHLGDVLSKARRAAGVSLEDAAAAAGLSVDAWRTLEADGVVRQPLDFARVGELLGLKADRLERLAQGWHPLPRDLSQWRELRQIATTRAGNTVNCYLVWDEITREGALFDTGWDAAPVLEEIERNEVQLRHVFITHSHSDHIAALDAIRYRFPKVLLHTSSSSAPPQHRNRPTDFIHLGNLRISNRPTPGHADDGVIYIVGNWPEEAPHVAIIGDTLFAGSMANGFVSWAALKQSVREQILSLPPETLLCPGHGPVTTVAEERDNNPFL